jgi:predicted DNA-binding transcriptional regulator AlpA
MSQIRSVQEAAAALGVSVSTMNHWRVSGFGPRFVKLGRRVGYRDEDLQAFIAKGLRESTSTSEVAA